jgi:hypothetical protein
MNDMTVKELRNPFNTCCGEEKTVPELSYSEAEYIVPFVLCVLTLMIVESW